MAIKVDRDLEFFPAIKKIMEKLELIKKDTNFLIKEFDKVIKEKKKVK